MPNNYEGKLTSSQAKMLREYRAGGWTIKELAWFFGINTSSTHDIIIGRTHAGAGGPIQTPRRYKPRMNQYYYR